MNADFDIRDDQACLGRRSGSECRNVQRFGLASLIADLVRINLKRPLSQFELKIKEKPTDFAPVRTNI